VSTNHSKRLYTINAYKPGGLKYRLREIDGAFPLIIWSKDKPNSIDFGVIYMYSSDRAGIGRRSL